MILPIIRQFPYIGKNKSFKAIDFKTKLWQTKPQTDVSADKGIEVGRDIDLNFKEPLKQGEVKEVMLKHLAYHRMN